MPENPVICTSERGQFCRHVLVEVGQPGSPCEPSLFCAACGEPVLDTSQAVVFA